MEYHFFVGYGGDMNQSKENITTTPEEPTHSEIQKEIDEVYSTINEDQGDYDKQLLTLSSGFLAVSLAFIKDIVPLNDAIYLWFLYLSFILLVLCVFSVLFSYQFSIAGLFKAKEYWDNLLVGKKNATFPYIYAHRIGIINRISGSFFFFGVVSLVLFVILNLNHEATMQNNRSATKDGAYLKIPSNDNTIEKGAHIKAPPPPPPPAVPPATPIPNSGGGGGSKQSSKQ
jgi:hypothetical protein